jgi:hypothetical protein
MSVLVRPKFGESKTRRRQLRTAGPTSRRSTVARPVEVTERLTPAPAGDDHARERGQLQDHALYNCHCGFVFQAPVSTSVGCPHCGCTQAW